MSVVILTFFLLLFELASVSGTFKEVRLKAVTQFQGLKQFYEMIKTQGRRRNVEINARTKLEICGSIFVNPFFEVRGESAFIITNESNRKLLKERYEELFNEFFETSTTSSSEPTCYGTSSGRNIEYTHINPNINRTVKVEGDVPNQFNYYEEPVFTCLSYSREGSNIVLKKYFISASDYNMNRAINTTGINKYVAGRVVFREVTGPGNELLVFALAEESGQTFKRGEEAVEKFYISKRQRHSPSDNSENDPVCALTPSEQLRLCAIIVNSPDMERVGYEFVPQSLFLEADCKFQLISFKTPRGLQATSNREYREWMIGCQVKNLSNMYEPFYVSRGYAANSAFVYKPIFGFFYSYLFLDTISVLRD